MQVTKLVYEVNEEDVIRARNQLKAALLYQIDSSGGEFCPKTILVADTFLLYEVPRFVPPTYNLLRPIFKRR